MKFSPRYRFTVSPIAVAIALMVRPVAADVIAASAFDHGA
jgi:hypothetical protein